MSESKAWMKAEWQRQSAHLGETQRRVQELESALGEAIESIEDWAGYASEYFQEKHDLQGELKRLRAVLGNLNAVSQA